MHNKAIRCQTDSTQKVLNMDGNKRTCRKGGAENERPEKYQSVDVGNNGDCSNRSTPTLPSSADGMSAVSDRPSLTSVSYHSAMTLSLCHVTTDLFVEQRVQTLYPNGCLIGLFQP